MSDPITVLVVDDQELVRAGFCVILEAAEGTEVVGEAADGASAVAQAAELKPGVVLMDIRMPGMDGLKPASLLLTRPNRPKSSCFPRFDPDATVTPALPPGPGGSFLKDLPKADPM